MTTPEDDLAEGLMIIHDALEAWCDCDEGRTLAELNRLGNAPAINALAYMFDALTRAWTLAADDPEIAPYLARARIREALPNIVNVDIPAGGAAAIIHEAMRAEGIE